MKRKKILIALFILTALLFVSLDGSGQTTITDSTVCTSHENVKRTVLKIRLLEEEKRLAIETATVSEIENQELSRELRSIERKISLQRIAKPFKEIGKAVGFFFVGFGVNELRKI